MRRRLIAAALACAGLGSPGFAHAAPVEWDRQSMKLRGERVFLNGGEVHYYRMPSPRSWPDVLAKLRAAGLNTISVYVPWQLHEPRPGRFRFSGRFDFERFLRLARDAGLYVVVRPGPYVQSEIGGGGYPAWLLGRPGVLRTLDPRYTRAWRRWYRAVMPRIARWELGRRRGGSVIAVQVENEFPGGGGETTEQAREYMRSLVAAAKAGGVRVPISHNDVQFAGSQISRGHFADIVDVFGFDNYPYGFKCCPEWSESTFSQVDQFESYYRGRGVTRSPLYVAEVQGGMAPIAGDDGKSQADRYRKLIGYGTVQDHSLVAQGLTFITRYMTFGGTTWGNLVFPNDGTSYDYAAPIREWGGLGPRYDELRRVSLQIRAAGRSLVATEAVGGRVTTSDPGALYKVRRSMAGGGGLHIFLRNADPAPGRAPTLTVDGRTTLPVPLPGHSARWLLAGARLAGWGIDLTTAEVALATGRHLGLFGDRGERYEVTLDGRRIEFVPRARPQLRRLEDGRLLILLSREAAARLWPVRGRVLLGPRLVTARAVETDRRTRALLIGEDVRRYYGVPGSGFIWYRGRFEGTAAGLCIEGRHRYHVWLNGRSLGTVTSAAEAPGPNGFGGLGVTTPVNQQVEIDFPPGASKAGENVLAVLVESFGHSMDAIAFNQAKQARGLVSASLERRGSPTCGFELGGETTDLFGAGNPRTLPATPRPSGGIEWRLRGGDPFAYPNTSGLHGEMRGFHRPGFPDRSWRRVALPGRLPLGPGEVGWVRTRFRLSIPRTVRVPLGLWLYGSSHPSEIYLNGVHIARAGRNRVARFVLPPGVLRPRGVNTLAIARWNVDGVPNGMDRPVLSAFGKTRSRPLVAVLWAGRHR